MDVPCNACLTGPSGFQGHAELMVQTLGDGRLLSQCQRCRAFWVRTAHAGGAFAWSGITERMAFNSALGVTVPPRTRGPGQGGKKIPLPISSGRGIQGVF